MEKSKEPIRIRKRTLRNGNTSLYLDIYINGKRSYEFLNLYLVPEKTRADKEKNKETLKLADAVRAQRVVELQNGRFGFEDGYKLDTIFLDYYRMLCEKRHENPESLGNWGNWYSALKHLERYCAKKPQHDVQRRDPCICAGLQGLPRQDSPCPGQEEENKNDRGHEADIQRHEDLLLQQTPRLHQPSL